MRKTRIRVGEGALPREKHFGRAADGTAPPVSAVGPSKRAVGPSAEGDVLPAAYFGNTERTTKGKEKPSPHMRPQNIDGIRPKSLSKRAQSTGAPRVSTGVLVR